LAHSVHDSVYFPSCVATDPHSIRIRTDELRTVREAMRDFGSLLADLDEGEVEKLVLTQRNRIRAIVVSVERWSEVEQILASGEQAEESAPARTRGSSAL
jgi:hypothetical protein